MNYRSFTKEGKKFNEDDVYVDSKNRFGFIIDGATGLLKEHIALNYDSDAQWYSHTLKKFLINNLPNASKSIKQIIKEAIIYLNKQYNAFENSQNIVSKPSAGIAVFRVVGKKIEYFILGDCSLIVKYKNNRVLHLKLNDLTRLDNININKMKVIAKKKNIDVVDARPYINDDLLKTRLMQNTKNGYWILSDNIEAVNYAKTGYLDAEKVFHIVGLTDGFSQIIDLFGLYNKKTLLEKIEQSVSLQDLYNELYDMQEKDNKCNKFPRFKCRDDASIFSALI